MFSWLKRSSRPARVRTLPRTLLRLEALEARDCPAGPTITAFSVQVQSGRQVLLTGTVLDNDPATVTVNFTGQVTGSASVTVAGSFSQTATASGLGTVTAQATDSQALTSNQMQATITSTPPTITLSASAQQSGGTIVLSGQVTVGTASGLTVTLGGTASGSGVTDANGNYSISVAASSWSPGNATATTTDAWGQASNTANVALTNTAPSISSFSVSYNANGLAIFRGLVTDEYAPGETVNLWGIPTLNAGPAPTSTTSPPAESTQTASPGYTTTTVRSDRQFIYSVQLTPQDHGTVSAQATDWLGLTSNIATLTV